MNQHNLERSGLGDGGPEGSPRVSVIMGVFNAEATLEAAVRSMAGQTFRDWELIVCDDGSTDRSLELCRQLEAEHPGRIVVLSNPTNRKLAATLNHCLAHVRGDLVARMDADDLSLPDRLERQVAFLDANPAVDLVGTAMRRFNESGQGSVVTTIPHPERTTLRRAKPFNHATIVTRREVYELLGGYDESRRAERCEDYDLWFRFYACGFVGKNLAEPLYLVREDASAFRRRSIRGRLNEFQTAVAGFRRLGFPPSWYVWPALHLTKAIVPVPLLRHLRSLQAWGRKEAA